MLFQSYLTHPINVLRMGLDLQDLAHASVNNQIIDRYFLCDFGQASAHR